MNDRAQAHGSREARRTDHLDRLLPREVRLAAAGVVAEDSRRDDAGGGQREASEGAPDEVLRPRDVPRAPRAGPDSIPPGSPGERWRSTCSSWASRRGPLRSRGSRRRLSRSWGSRSRATSRRPVRSPSAISTGDSEARNSIRSSARAGSLPVPRVALEDGPLGRVRGQLEGSRADRRPGSARSRGRRDRGAPVGQQRRERSEPGAASRIRSSSSEATSMPGNGSAPFRRETRARPRSRRRRPASRRGRAGSSARGRT